MVDDKILNNSFDDVEYGIERTTQQAISILPQVAHMYEESTSESIEDLYTERKMRNLMADFFEASPFYEKYSGESKRVERSDLFDMYYYFKDRLNEIGEFNSVQVFCAIAEFFDVNYKVMYNDVIALEDKVVILEELSEMYGLKKKFSNVNRLF
jgi:hypothetical protein